MMGQETNGAGGMFKAFRTIPVILDIVEDMKELCPDAWLIDFTNPAGMVTEAVLRYGNWDNVVGLCNIPVGAMKQAAEKSGEKEEELFFKFAGINHFHWHKVWSKTGKEITNELIDKYYKNGEEALVANISNAEFIYGQVKHLGMIPCPYHHYYYITGEMLEHQLEDYAKNGTRAEVVKRLEDSLFELYKDRSYFIKKIS